ncbi:MAG: HupE/UreJ family protein [Verrucomicrobia bacterium]|nr:HupE/UreJ family protein [Verrucomicrobiota bacterium]
MTTRLLTKTCLALAGWLLLLLLLLSAATTRTAMAHPVTQGALEITLLPEAVVVQARVANEEAFVAEAFGAQAPSNEPQEVRRRHGAYLCEHLRIEADGVALTGTVEAITPPESATPESMIGYRLRYPLPTGAGTNARVFALRQNVLNEFLFAPGNPWEATYIVRVVAAGHLWREGLLLTRREPLELRLDSVGSEQAGAAAATPLDRFALASAFLKHGIVHILTGYDHLLFVTGLVLAAATLWELFKVVLAFTVAHSITLTLAALDLVRVPERVVEPMIAASIVIVALQNVLAPRRSHGRARLAVAFGFGLFHGLGYAGGLLEAMQGMNTTTISLAIVSFSVGVEIGHQIVVIPLFVVLRAFRRRDGAATAAGKAAPAPLHQALRVASCAVAACGLVYFIAALRGF